MVLWLNQMSVVQPILEQIRPVVLAALELVRAPTGQLKARRKDLVDRVGALRDFLAKNVPSSRHLGPDDDGFLQAGEGSQAEPPAAAPPRAAKVAAGARGGK